ncbi:MAG: hypothetical protein Q8O88_02255 [bacterium]|nr:hypothetical protein [bacterium]
MLEDQQLQTPGWATETMMAINKLTPDIKEKSFDPDWFLLRQRLEKAEKIMGTTSKILSDLQIELNEMIDQAVWEIAGEKLAGNIVKEESWRGEYCAALSIRNWLDERLKSE